MTLRLLAVGDVHLGRRAAGVPARVAQELGGLEALGPREAWRATVAAALRERVDAVLLLGDVVDDEDHYLEGWSELVGGCARLADAQIALAAVAGNHDVRVLPRLCEAVPSLRLVGAGGRWEALELCEGRLRVVGWSYPKAHARCDPSAEPALLHALGAPFDGPTVGLLHGDLDAASSDYARFRRSALESAGADAWLLGHVHAPSFALGAEGALPLGYLGSLTGLDPSERGAHGPWLLRFERKRLAEARQLPLAPLRWERIELALEGLCTREELEAALVGAVHAAVERLGDGSGDGSGNARALGLRVVLRGATSLFGTLEAWAQEQQEQLAPTLEGRLVFVESFVHEARPALELEALARDDDPPGLLARRLLALAPGAPRTPERAELLRLARRALEQVGSAPAFVRCASGLSAAGEDALAARAHAAGLRALEALCAQRPRTQGSTEAPRERSSEPRERA